VEIGHPLIEAGVPAYIDKPFAYDLDDARLLWSSPSGRGSP